MLIQIHIPPHGLNRMNFINTVTMNRISTLCFSAFLVLIASCEKEPYINLGFDSTINKNSNGLAIAHISHNDERIYLTGIISLMETFDARSGYWELKYQSYNGIGTIDLHLNK